LKKGSVPFKKKENKNLSMAGVKMLATASAGTKDQAHDL